MRRVLLSFALSACTASSPGSAPTPRRVAAAVGVNNVILVTIDTLRADIIGAYGGPAHTPVLDRLAVEGWMFESCISASMLTNPSHASIMTSLYPRDHGVHDNESGIDNGLRTVATAMSRNGFRTGAVIGFPHLNPNVSNLGRGFERVVKATRRERNASKTSRLTLELIDQLANGPGVGGGRFFVWAHYVDPHAPYEPPAEILAGVETVPGRTPMRLAVAAAPGFQRNNPWFKRAFRQHRTTQQLAHKYIAEVEVADAGLGELIAGLEQRGLAARTAIVITSDHGENLGEHQLYFHHGGLYRQTVHVPLIMRVPGTQPRRLGGLVATVDIAPTILELAGVPRWEPMRGRSLLGMVNGVEGGREFLFSEHMRQQMLSVRSDEGTLIVHRKTTRQFPSYPLRAGKRELYDRVRDPLETTPVPIDGELGQTLERGLQGYLGLGLRLTARRPTRQDRESLRALGYVE